VRDAFLEHWLEEAVATPGITGFRDVESARPVLLDDAVRARAIVETFPGRVVDVGSGGGSPGIPLAVVLHTRSFTLLEAERRKCDFLERTTAALPNVDVVWGRAEEQQVDVFGLALAKALAKPPVAAELCLPLVRAGGAAVLWVGETADRAAIGRAADLLGGELESDTAGLIVLRKITATPPGFPCRAGMAKKHPLS
jgi:16S rRNA (guanine527-N7)-methyltransferase